jgi:hypothetical protein
MTRTTRPAQISATLIAAVRIAAVPTAAAVLALLAGCTTAVSGSAAADPAPTPTEGPGSDPVVWADHVCGAVLSFAVPATTPPVVAPAADLPTVQRAVSDYLGAVLTGVQQGRTQLAAVGRSPLQGGAEAVGRAESALEFLEQDFTGAKNAVDSADPKNPDSVKAALTRAQSTFDAITPPNPLSDLSSTPRLQRAAEHAAQCQQLSALSTAAPR